MQQCLMDYPCRLSGDRDTYQCPFAVVEVQAGPEGSRGVPRSPGQGKARRAQGHPG